MAKAGIRVGLFIAGWVAGAVLWGWLLLVELGIGASAIVFWITFGLWPFAPFGFGVLAAWLPQDDEDRPAVASDAKP